MKSIDKLNMKFRCWPSNMQKHIVGRGTVIDSCTCKLVGGFRESWWRGGVSWTGAWTLCGGWWDWCWKRLNSPVWVWSGCRCEQWKHNETFRYWINTDVKCIFNNSTGGSPTEEERRNYRNSEIEKQKQSKFFRQVNVVLPSICALLGRFVLLPKNCYWTIKVN